MKNRLKILVLVILIIVMIAGIGFLIYNAVRSIKYNQNAKNPVVTLDVEGYGQVKMELYPDYAPNTVRHFIKLIQNGYYDGKVFYGTDGKAVNVGMEKNEPVTPEEGTEPTPETTDSTSGEKNAVEDVLRVSDIDTSVQKSETEDSLPTDENDPDYKITIDGEFVANGYDKNTLRFEYGVVGLYRTDYEGYSTDLSSESYNSGKSLFFIVTQEDSTLNGMYAGFGKVIEGMDIVEKINQLPVIAETSESETETTTDEDKNKIQYFENLPVITKATVETYGIDYGMPEFEKAFDYDQYVSNLLLQYYRNQ